LVELESRLSELQGDNLRMEQRLLDMEYSSYSTTTTSRISAGEERGGGMTLIDDVLRDYSRQALFIGDSRSSDVDINAKHKSIVDADDYESADKVCYGVYIFPHASSIMNVKPSILFLFQCKRSWCKSSTSVEPGSMQHV